MLSKLSQMCPRLGLVWIIALTTFLHRAAINGHAAPSPGTKVTPEESGTKAVGFFEETTIGVNVEERAAPPQYFTNADFERMVSEGRTLFELMIASIQQADHIMHGHSQSLFTDYNDLAENGWVNNEDHHGMRVCHRYAHFLGASNDKAENSDRRFKHSRQWKNPSTGQTMTPTLGHFENVYNIRDRVIYLIDRCSPSAMVKRHPHRHLTAPPLKFWSDVAFLEWAHEQGNTANIHAPKYMFISSVTNGLTRSLLDYIKKKRGIKEWGELPGGTEFGPSDDEYLALLATPNIYGPTYFLIQHKAQMNIHMIESVKIVGGLMMNMILKIVERQNEVENDTSIRASISSAPTNKIHYNSSSSYSKL